MGPHRTSAIARLGRARRPGFAIMWIMVAVALVAAIAAVAAPALVTINDYERVQRTSELLAKVAEGVDSFNLLVKRGGPAFTTPNRLSQLVVPVVNGGQAGCTSQTYNATAVTNWNTFGPLSTIYVPTNGLWTPIGRLSDLASDTPGVAGRLRNSTSDPYFIQIPNVDVWLARSMDAMVDGDENPAAGTVQYDLLASDSTVLLSYQVTLAHVPAC